MNCTYQDVQDLDVDVYDVLVEELSKKPDVGETD